MHASKAGVSLRNIALTPERIPTFIIPSKLQSPHAQLDSETDQSRLLSQSSPNQQLSASTPSSLVPRLPSTPTMRAKLHRNLSPGEDLSDPSTRAAMSLPHIDKVTTSYGFRALAQSPCTRRRESLFHKGAKTTGPSFETNMDCLSRPSSSVDVGDKRRTTSTNSNLADVPPSTAAPSPSVQILKTGRAAGLQRSAQEAAEDNERLFTELICSLEKWHTEVKELIKAQAKAQVSRAEGLLEQLEQEIAELKREDTELEQLSHTEDHIHFLQSYSNPSVSSSDLPAIVVSPHQYFGYVSEAVSELREKLQGFLKGQWTKISSTVNTVDVLLPPEPKTREQFLQYSCQLTLDPNTAHCKLSLSDGNKKMTAKLNHSYPGHPDRFTDRCQVLCSEGLSGRCYWEVERSGKDVSIAVSYKDIKTTGRIDSALGLNDKSWSLQCHHGYHFRHNNVEIQVSGPQSSRVGVYLDHKAGSLSFYSVSGTMILLHRVQTTFTQPLYPGFCFGYVGDTAELCKL